MFDSSMRETLTKNHFSITFSKGQDTEFNNVQTIIYKNGNNCCIVYVGYTVNDIHFMIQISEYYLKAVRDFGKIEKESEEVFLNTSLSQKRIPFFYKIFVCEGGIQTPRFYLEPSSAEMLCVQSFKIGEVKTETDFKNNVLNMLQIGHKLYSEYESAVECENKSKTAREIGALIKVFFLLS